MSFLQPLLLLALPLVALPVIIHLINQRRYQTMEWGAMSFLLSANRMSRGYARLRQWLIMAMRMLAVAGMIFAVSRPLASGWLGLTAGGQADTTLVLVDRSPSMQQRMAGSGISKLDAARQQLVETLETLGSKRWVLIDSATAKPTEIASPAALLDSPQATGVSAAADLPSMLQAAHDYIKANNPGTTEIWIASDLHTNDWQAENGRWASLRQAFLEFPQAIRFHLLAYGSAGTAAGSQPNASIRVTEARREEIGGRVDLVLSLEVNRELTNDGGDQKQTLPLQFEIDGARSEMNIEIAGNKYSLKDHRLSLAGNTIQGWGKVSLPADVNPADDEAYFVFDQPTTRRTVVVAEDADRVRALQLAASISPLAGLESVAEIVAPDALTTLAWEELALVLWQAPLPKGAAAKLVSSCVDRGGQVIFFPPRDPSATSIYGMAWQAWVDTNQINDKQPLTPDNWRSDQDLLTKTRSGQALPVGKWKVNRYCTLNSKSDTLTAVNLATLPGGVPLVTRVITDHGGVYFCATTADQRDSSLATDGVVLYAAVQRVIDSGVSVLGKARQQTAGDSLPISSQPWSQTAVSKAPTAQQALSTDYQYYQGVYQSGDRLVAINRPDREDTADAVADERINRLFAGLNFDRVNQSSASSGGLVQEIWRFFLAAMIIALVAEAALCLPRIAQPEAAPAFQSRITRPAMPQETPEPLEAVAS